MGIDIDQETARGKEECGESEKIQNNRELLKKAIGVWD